MGKGSNIQYIVKHGKQVDYDNTSTCGGCVLLSSTLTRIPVLKVSTKTGLVTK